MLWYPVETYRSMAYILYTSQAFAKQKQETEKQSSSNNSTDFIILDNCHIHDTFCNRIVYSTKYQNKSCYGTYLIRIEQTYHKRGRNIFVFFHNDT